MFASAVEEDCRAELSEQCVGYLTHMQAATLKMTRLIDALLNFSKAGRKELRSEEVDLSSLVARVISELREPSQDLEVDVQPSLKVSADADLMTAVVSNLISNALKYSKQMKPAQVRFFETTTPLGRTFCVQDNGIGFDAQNAEDIFQPFFRLHPNTAFEGSGVGLSTVRRILERHGGKIWCQSSPGAGASFFFTVGPKEST